MNVKSSLAIARRALTLIRKGWTKDTLARTKNGSGIGPEAGNAVKWCALGAITKAYSDVRNLSPEVTASDRDHLISKLIATVGTDIPVWNDSPGTTKANVICGFQKVIEKLETQAERSK